MKKVLQAMIVVLFLFLGGCGGEKRLETRMINGESIVFQVGSKKPYSGDYSVTGFNRDGSTYIKQQGEYKKGKFNGLNKWYYSNGVASRESYYDLGKLSGKYKTYSYSGKLEIETTYKAGEINGVYKEYFYTGQVRVEKNFKLGKLDGALREYDIKGQLRFEKNFKMDQYHGVCKEYFDNGQLLSSSNYEMGKLNGKLESYYKNGQLSYEGNFKLGKEEGVHKRYYENGQLQSEKNYINGVIDGIDNWYPLQSKKNLQNNTDNIAQDISKTEKEDLNKIDNNIEKYPNGNIKKIETSQSENAVLTVTTVTYFEDGNINSEQNYTYFKLKGLEDYESIHTTSNYKEYYPNKKLKTSYEEKMEKSGIYEYSSVTYFEDGKVMKKLTGEYLESTGKDLNYKSLVYSPTGVIVSDDIFDDKNSDAAILREYYDNGKIKMEKKYIKDSSGEEKVISLVNYDNVEELKPEIEASVKNNPQQINPIENGASDVPKDKAKEKKKMPQCKNYYKGSERDQMIIINKERKYVDSNGCIL